MRGRSGCGNASSTLALHGPLTAVPAMKALVTGASGFVGRHLVAHLVACGDEVVQCDRSVSAEVHYLDITDAAAAIALVTDVQPDVIYHLAGWADVGGSWKAPVEA